MLITLTIGTTCSIWLCHVFNQFGIFGTITYQFPILQVTIFAVALLLVQGVFTLIVAWFIKQQSLVERMKAME